MRGYCDAYSAWRAGNPKDQFTFTVVEVIDKDGTNISCGGWLRQKQGPYEAYTYWPTTAYHICPANSRNYVANDCDCDFGYTERDGKCELQNNDPDSDPPNEPGDPDGPGSSDNPGGPGDASGPSDPGNTGDGPGGSSCPASAYGDPGQSSPNPILLSTGEKSLRDADFVDASAHPLGFSRNYLHRRSSNLGALGAGWSHSYAERLQHEPAVAASARVKPSPAKLTIFLSDGSARWFSPSGSNWVALDSADTLASTPQGWTHKSASDDVVRKFDASGKLLSHQQRNGWTYQYSYNAAGKLQTVTNQFGRTLQLAYNGSSQLTSVSMAGSVKATYGYDSTGRLQSVGFADSTSKTYLYENAALPTAVTGIVDQNGVRLATFAYNTNGFAVKTERAGNVAVMKLATHLSRMAPPPSKTR